jgi:hypothetical protein
MQHASAPVAASLFSSGAHLPLEVALPVIAAVVLLRVVAARRRGQPALGREIIVRCGKGHLFETSWSSLGSLTSIRLGFTRFQYCPVGDHWSLVKPVKDSDLTPEDRRIARQNRGTPSRSAGRSPALILRAARPSAPARRLLRCGGDAIRAAA